MENNLGVSKFFWRSFSKKDRNSKKKIGVSIIIFEKFQIFENNLGYRGYPHFFFDFLRKIWNFSKKNFYTPRFFVKKSEISESFLLPKKKFDPQKNFGYPQKISDPQKIFFATPKKIFGAKNIWVPPEIFQFKGNSFVFEFCLVWREFLCIWVLSRPSVTHT